MSTSTVKNVRVYDIEWDTDGEQIPEELGLPRSFKTRFTLTTEDGETPSPQEEIDSRIEGMLNELLSEHYNYLHKGFHWEYTEHFLDQYLGLDGENPYFLFQGETQSGLLTLKTGRDFNTFSHKQDFEALLTDRALGLIESLGNQIELLICSTLPGDGQLVTTDRIENDDGSRILRLFVNFPLLELYDSDLAERFLINQIRSNLKLYRIIPDD